MFNFLNSAAVWLRFFAVKKFFSQAGYFMSLLNTGMAAIL